MRPVEDIPAAAEYPARPDRDPVVPPGHVEVYARDMTVALSADVALATVQAHLAAHDEWLPIDGAPAASIGPLIERNSTGPLRLGYGAWRDLLLGCQFHNGLGELITAGGRAVKNVAGYDLTKFMVGQHGAFGRVVTATTRTYRRPAGALLARFAFHPDRLNALLPTPCRPQWAMVVPGAASGAPELHCGYLADERTLAYYRAALPAHGPLDVLEQTLDADTALRARHWLGGADETFRAAVPPGTVADFVAAAGLQAWAADAAFGVIVGPLAGIDFARVASAARSLGGRATATRDGRPVADAASDGERRVLHSLKQAFDPAGRLTPLPF